MADLDDVRAVAPAVLRHRLVTNFAAEAADRTSEDLVRELVGNKAWLGGLRHGATLETRRPGRIGRAFSFMVLPRAQAAGSRK